MNQKTVLFCGLTLFIGLIIFSLTIGKTASSTIKITEQELLSDYQDSPFGIHDPSVPEVDSIEDVAAIGAKWVRYAGRNGMVWDFIEPQKGKYNWEFHNRLYLETYQNNIKMNVVVLAYNKLDSGDREFGYIPNDMNWYLEFLEKAVECYDGDGIDDAPGSPVVDVWEIDNEPDLSLNPIGSGFKDTPQNYALLLKESYRVIKEANPNAKVAFAGLAGPKGIKGFFVQALDELERIKDFPDNRYFEIAGFHWSGQFMGNYQKEILPEETYYFDNSISEMKIEMKKRGYRNIPIWISEMSYNDGKPFDLPFLTEPRTEKEQANELLKRYVYSIVKGADKIFWAKLTEWSNFGGAGVNNYFDNVGLIHNPANDGKSHKKLAYYTYKKMVEVLEDSDWNNIQTLKESDNIYIYKFTKDSKSVYVLWWDYFDDIGSSKTITLNVDFTGHALVTNAVPYAESGAFLNENDYPNFFETQILNVTSGKITLTLSKDPVFVEGTKGIRRRR
ncbi:MAG: hypothetical protein ACE5WD_10145 [Candidatus Aminicenantia bacterium]